MADSSSSSVSSSSTFPVETPENAIIDAVSGVASGMAQQVQAFGQQEFANTTGVTNQSVGNFFNVSNNMLGLSNNLTDQYNNLFAPENAQLVADANSYASPARMDVDMGMAGATQAQAGQSALTKAQQQLTDFGIDPSSGRYAALDQAAAVQNSANVAGAENQQRQTDIATGENLRTQAVQVGASLPQSIANVNNTAIQANAGATNASLANANTGVALESAPDAFLNTAANVKLPFSASSGSSSSNSQQQGGNTGGSGNSSAGSGGGGSGGGGSSPSGTAASGDQANDTSAMGIDGGTTYGGGTQPDAQSQSIPDQGFQGQGGGTSDSYGDMGIDGGGDFSGGGDFARGGPVMLSQGGTAGIQLADPDDDGSSQFAGHVPASASPSGGQKVDDVQASGPANSDIHLNAHEFVVPQDVSLWKGQEFFQNLINDSRKKLAMASAKPTPARSQQGR